MSATLHVLLVLYSAGLGPSGVVEFHGLVAETRLSFGEILAGKLHLVLDVAQVDRPLDDNDFLTDETGRRRLSPGTVAEDLERRGVKPRKYPLLLAFFRAPQTAHALAIERGGDVLQVSLAARGSLSMEDALAEALAVLLDAPAPEGRSLQALLQSVPENAWFRLVGAGTEPPATSDFAPLFERVAIPSGNRSVFLSFVGQAPERPRLSLGAKTVSLHPIGVGPAEVWGAWIDLPSGEGAENALVGGAPLTRVERARVGYVSARWKESSGRGPAILEAEVREEALGGSLRIPRAKLTVKGAKVLLREFPGATHMGQREEGPVPVDVMGDLAGFRLKPARLGGQPEAGRAVSGTTPPSGTWILGVVRP